MEKFIDDVLNQFEESITDKVFLMIQNDRVLFHRWLDLIQDKKRNYVNGEIAKAIKKSFGIKKKKKKIKPKSFLINFFKNFKKKTK